MTHFPLVCPVDDCVSCSNVLSVRVTSARCCENEEEMQKVERKTRRIVARIDFFAVVQEGTMIAGSRAKECGTERKYLAREERKKL